MPELKDFSDTTLKAELKRREEEAQKEDLLRKRERIITLQQALTKELINVLTPQHGRTSCGDTDRRNGYTFYDRPRCARCALLDIKDGIVPSDANIEISFLF